MTKFNALCPGLDVLSTHSVLGMQDPSLFMSVVECCCRVIVCALEVEAKGYTVFCSVVAWFDEGEEEASLKIFNLKKY